MQGVAASSTVLKDLPKGKLTNTVQHIQVYKSQGNQMSKNSRKPWKPIYIFLMTLRSFTLLRSCYVSVSIYSQVNFIRPKSSHLGHGSPLMPNTALRDRPPRRRPTAPGTRTRLWGERAPAGLARSRQRPPPPRHCHLYVCLREPSHVQNPTANSLWFWNDTKIKKKSTCALVCKKAAATFSNLD